MESSEDTCGLALPFPCFLPGCWDDLQTAQPFPFKPREYEQRLLSRVELEHEFGWLVTPLHGGQRAWLALMAGATWVPGEAALQPLLSQLVSSLEPQCPCANAGSCDFPTFILLPPQAATGFAFV